MKNYIHLLLFFMIVIAFISCHKYPLDEHYYFAEGDKAWLVYKDGDTVLFKDSASSVVDTIKFGKMECGTSQFEVDDGNEHRHNVYREYCCFRDTSKKDSTGYPGVYVCIDAGSEGTLMNIFWGNTFNLYLQKNYLLLDSLRVNNLTYKKVYVLVGLDRANPVQRLYLNKANGVLRYENENGKKWEIVNH